MLYQCMTGTPQFTGLSSVAYPITCEDYKNNLCRANQGVCDIQGNSQILAKEN